MRIYLINLLLLVLSAISFAQKGLPDSLYKIYLTAKDDSVLYEAAIRIYDYYEELNRDSAYFYADQGVVLSARNNKKLNQAYSLSRKAYQQVNLGRFADALHSLLIAFSLSEDETNDKYYWQIDPLKNEKYKRFYALSCTHHIYAILMRETINREQQIIHFKEAKRIAVQINNPARSLLASLNLGRIYLEYNKPDSALLFENEALSIAKTSGGVKYLSTIYYYADIANMNLGDTSAGLYCFYQCIESAGTQVNIDGLTRGYHRLADYYIHLKNADSSLYYAIKSLDAMKSLGAISQIEYNIGDAYVSVYEAYRLKNQLDSTYKYLRLAHTASDSINYSRIQNLAEFQKLTLNEQRRLQNLEQDRVIYQNRIRTYFLLSGIGVLLLLAIIFYRNNRQKHKAKVKIEQAYENLKATQQQLIQSEKMASLGELTAGISHEIQNPLNFVNNFSEVNTELINEAVEELRMSNYELRSDLPNHPEIDLDGTNQSNQSSIFNIQSLTSLLIAIRENEEKIIHHGKRADAIVKGMLQHSQVGSEKKEPTDINALADEYLRITYHGLRAKDKSFNAIIKTDFDPSLERINIIPQDIGRVVLNLLTNAFYVENEKKQLNIQGYEPTVSVSTKKTGDKVEIAVGDNGNGVPQKVLDKIFQPFFTTKPTGQGTGLGLSLSYDIITKGQDGELKVETKEGQGSESTISLSA